jgi:Cys-tRNA(Pro)/Cys-tRNA(Cys) deacylase
MSKTNAVRILESLKVPHNTFEYEVDENDLSGVSVAHKISIDEEKVYKTLVTRNDRNEIFVFCIPVNQELNLKKAAIAAKSKKIEMIKLTELLPLTGYVRGGCSPIGMKKNYPVIIEETAQLLDKIYVSAGMRGIQIEISPIDLSNIIDAKFEDLI